MGYHNDIITLPYTLEDACEAFDYQTDDLEDLLTNGDVNRWARYKPVEYYLSSPYGYALTEAQRKSVNYGLDNIPYWSSRMLGNMLNFWFGIDTSSPISRKSASSQNTGAISVHRRPSGSVT